MDAALIAEKNGFEQLFETDKTVWTKEKLMACLKKIINKDDFSKISKIDVLQFTTTQQFGNDVVKCYLQNLIKKPDFRLQTYSTAYGTVYGLFDDLIGLQNVPLFHKYVNLPRSDYYYSEANQIPGRIANSTKMDFFSKSDIVLIIYQYLEPLVGEKKAEILCSKAFEHFEKCYELVPVETADQILDDLDMIDDMSNIDEPVFEHLEKLIKPSFLEAPAVRLYRDMVGDYYFAKEVEVAVKFAFKKRYPAEKFPEDWNQRPENAQDDGGNSEFIRLDNEEDRALGVLQIVGLEELEELLESLKLKIEDLNIINLIDEETWVHAIRYPVISPYGSHCRFATHSFSELIKNLTMDLRLFQRIKRSNLLKVTQWLTNQKVLFDEKRTYPFMIESSKLDEIKKKAHIELKRLCTEPVYKIPVKPSFSKLEIIDEAKKFSPVFNIQEIVLTHSNCTSPYSHHSFYDVCEALVWGTIAKLQRRGIFETFAFYQMGKAKQPSKDYFQNVAPTIIKSFREAGLPPSVKCGKNDLGELRAPKNKKNIKPDFSTKKIDKEAIIIELLKCLNLNFEQFRSFKIEKLKEYFDEEEWGFLKEVFESKEKRKDIEKVFDIEIKNEVYTLKRRSAELMTSILIGNVKVEKSLKGNVEKLENEMKLKEVEIERLNKQISDTVRQSIEKIRKSKAESEKKVQELQNMLEKANKNLEEAQKNSNTHASTIKQSYREDFNKLNKECAEKDVKIQKLQEELKESYEKLRTEREKKYSQADEELKTATKKMKKTKIELEDLKCWKTAKSEQIAQLEKENMSLKTQLEIAEEQKPGTSSEEHVEELEEEENKKDIVEELLSRNEQLNSELQKMTEKCEELESRQRT